MNSAIYSSESLKVILLVEPNDECRLTAKWFLTEFGWAVDAAHNAEEALAAFDPAIHNVVVTSSILPGMTGLEMAHIIKLRSSSTPVVLYAESAPKDRSCLDLIIPRPTHLLALKQAVDSLLAARPAASSESEVHRSEAAL